MREVRRAYELASKEAEAARGDRTEVEAARERLKEMAGEIEARRAQLERAERDRREIRRYATELVERVKAEADIQKYLIDRRMIT